MEPSLKGFATLSTEGDMHNNWRLFKRQFLTYIDAYYAEAKEKQKIGILLHHGGDYCLDIYETFKCSNEETLCSLLEKFDGHFIPKTNVTYERYQIFTRKQQTEESFEQYMTVLKRMSQSCNFGVIQDELVRDLFICGINNPGLQRQLLGATNLTLEKSLDICRNHTVVDKQISQMEKVCEPNIKKEVDIDIVKKKTENNRECQYCGYKHDYGKCPAYGKTCAICKNISRLTIPRLAVSDSGVYWCQASNAYDSHYSAVQINVQGGCAGSDFGWCFDNETEALAPNGLGCPCYSTKFGCCPDGETPAHGHGHEGCCLLHTFGCCPDNYKPAEGPHLEGCGCQYARFGCCPDNVTYARGPHNEGCGCQYSTYGCCPDRDTEASGPNFEGCGCHTYQFGCCPDGVTIAKGPRRRGCHCYESKYGCCGDGETAASGPEKQGCDCSSSKYGCCPDGITEAKGSKFVGCTNVPLIDNRQAICSLSSDSGSCQNYSLLWYYDMEYGDCSRFYYGGCEGNANRFNTKKECEDVCVQPSPQDICKLPKVKGACPGDNVRWYYDNEKEECSQFVFGGCYGNANNFYSRELCEVQCGHTRTTDECSLLIGRGSCSGNFSRWGFNAETRRCEQFMWGGCEGNSNRFGSEAACVQRCDPPGDPKPQCTQPQDVGNCTNKEAMWSFNQSENRCVPFYYTGCGGNDNRFDNEQSCIDTCPSYYNPAINEVTGLKKKEATLLSNLLPTPDKDMTTMSTVPPLGDTQFTTETESSVTENSKSKLSFTSEETSPITITTLKFQTETSEEIALTNRPQGTSEITSEPPNCDRFNDECSRLLCGELGVKVIRNEDGCKRCSCVPLQIDCEPLRHECEKLKCTYGMDRQTGSDGCERCRCTGHPCDNKECSEGDRCVTLPYRDPITRDTRYSAECRTVDKTGYCPAREESVAAGSCRRDCNDDADCRGIAKCCRRGCSQLCLETDQAIPPTAPLPYTTTDRPDLPELPRVNHETKLEVTGTEGGKAVLRCLFHGNPPPKITWTRGELTIDADEGRYRLLSDGALEIVSLYRNDSGVYICIADNGLGTARQEVHLQVKDPVTSTMSIAGEPNAVLTGELGRPLIIRCLVYGYPPPTVYWLRGLNGPMIPFSSSLYQIRLPGVLLIKRLTVETVGEYLCLAYNGIGRPATKLFVVRAYQTDDSPYISKYILPREEGRE